MELANGAWSMTGAIVKAIGEGLDQRTLNFLFRQQINGTKRNFGAIYEIIGDSTTSVSGIETTKMTTRIEIVRPTDQHLAMNVHLIVFSAEFEGLIGKSLLLVGTRVLCPC